MDGADLSGRIHPDAGSDDGQSPWLTPPSHILLECGDGHAHTQERSSSLGARTCASRWPWYCLPVFLRQAGLLRFGAGCRILSEPTWRRPFWSGSHTLPTSTLVWWWSVAASNCQRLRSWAENSAHYTPVGVAWESDSSSQLVGSAPQQDRRTSGMGERTEARLTAHTGAVQLRGRPPKSQCTTISKGGSPPSSPDRGVPDSDGYSTMSETVGHRQRCRGCRGSRERKWLVPVRLDMLIFKLTDPGVEVTYMLWCFDVDAFLEQYDEASMHSHIFASLRGYPGKWACMLDEGKDISVWDLLMHMERTFGNKCDYDAMIRTLYEVQQRNDEMVEEYMLCIHEVVMVIH